MKNAVFWGATPQKTAFYLQVSSTGIWADNGTRYLTNMKLNGNERRYISAVSVLCWNRHLCMYLSQVLTLISGMKGDKLET
jgi:hypothetical protein